MSGIPTSMRTLTEDELLAVAGGGSSVVGIVQNAVNGTQTTTVNGASVGFGTFTSANLPSLPAGTIVTIGPGTVSSLQIS
jgi:hypothetical protein